MQTKTAMALYIFFGASKICDLFGET